MPISCPSLTEPDFDNLFLDPQLQRKVLFHLSQSIFDNPPMIDEGVDITWVSSKLWLCSCLRKRFSVCSGFKQWSIWHLNTRKYPVCTRETNLKTKPVLSTAKHREGRKTGPPWATVHTVPRPAPPLKLPLHETTSQAEWGLDAFQTDKEFINW